MQKPYIPSQLNICMVSHKFPILGRAADHGFLWPIARRMAQKGHKITILAWKNPQKKEVIEQDGVKAYFLGERAQGTYKQFPEMALQKFEELHNIEPFHLVHSIDANGLMIGQNRKKFRVAMAYDVEATQMSQIFAILGMAQENLGSLIRTGVAVTYKFLTTFLGKDRKILKTADAAFVTSPQQKIALERYYLFPETKTHTIPYGIEIGDLSPREKSEELSQRMGIPAHSKVIVTITDMTELEEVRSLLRAFEKVVIKKPASRLIIVGNGPRFKEIEYEMLSLALGSKVIFTGAVTNTDLPDYIALADVFVNISSRTSGFEPSTLEAMAQKKVIVGSEVSPISVVVEDGRDGFLIRPADISSLSTLMIQIFGGELAADEIGENARQKVMNLFDTEKMVEQTTQAYRATLQRTGFYRSDQSVWSWLVS